MTTKRKRLYRAADGYKPATGSIGNSMRARNLYAAAQVGGDPKSMRVPESPAHKRKSRKSDHAPHGKRN